MDDQRRRRAASAKIAAIREMAARERGSRMPIAGLEAVARDYRSAREALDRVRAQLAEEIVAAVRSGMRQNEIVRTTGYTRERVRQICREAGVEADG